MSLKAIQICIMARVPGLIIGAPGVGKTSSIYNLAESMDRHLEVVIASIREPSDFSGLPVIKDDGVHFEPPVWARRLANVENGILMLDEITTTPPATQAALLRVVLDRYVGDLKLPDSTSIIAAANPPEQAANGWTLTMPLANRFCHFIWENKAEEWAEGMISGWPKMPKTELPKDWDSKGNIQMARSKVVAFLRYRPHLGNVLPKDEASGGGAWPSNRSWDMASRLVAAAKACGHKETSDITFELVAGCVGTGPAVEFKAYCEEEVIVDFEELLKNPSKLADCWPKRGDRQFALLSGVVASVIGNNTKPRWDNGWRILVKAMELSASDIAVCCAKSLGRNRPDGDCIPPKEVIKLQKAMKGSGIWDM